MNLPRFGHGSEIWAPVGSGQGDSCAGGTRGPSPQQTPPPRRQTRSPGLRAEWPRRERHALQQTFLVCITYILDIVFKRDCVFSIVKTRAGVSSHVTSGPSKPKLRDCVVSCPERGPRACGCAGTAVRHPAGARSAPGPGRAQPQASAVDPRPWERTTWRGGKRVPPAGRCLPREKVQRRLSCAHLAPFPDVLVRSVTCPHLRRRGLGHR